MKTRALIAVSALVACAVAACSAGPDNRQTVPVDSAQPTTFHDVSVDRARIASGEVRVVDESVTLAGNASATTTTASKLCCFDCVCPTGGGACHCTNCTPCATLE